MVMTRLDILYHDRLIMVHLQHGLLVTARTLLAQPFGGIQMFLQLSVSVASFT